RDPGVVARAEGAGGHALEARDAAPDGRRDAPRDLRGCRIRRVRVEDGRVGDADAVGAELPRLRLDDLGGERHTSHMMSYLALAAPAARNCGERDRRTPWTS